MKLVVPMAGSQDLQDQTFSQPKTVIEIAGKPLIAHLIQKLTDLPIKKAVFIVDKERPNLRKQLQKEFNFECVFIKQVEKKGPAHAVLGAKNHIKPKEDILILFADTLIEFDPKHVTKCKTDGIVFTKTVSNPTRYGVAFINDNKITRLIEKPEIPSSDKALVGMYYFKKSKTIFESIQHIVNNEIKTKGFYHITDAIQVMVNNEYTITPQEVNYWNNCDTSQNLLEANKYLLKENNKQPNDTTTNVYIPPVHIDHTCEIKNCVIGPNVTVGKKTTITESRIKNTIIGRQSTIDGTVLNQSVIGRFTEVKSKTNKLTIGDYSEIEYS